MPWSRAQASRRRTAALVALVLCSAPLALGAALAPTAHADEATLPSTLQTFGDDETHLELAVPDGVTPTALRGTLSSSSTLGGEVVVLIGTREVARVEPGPAQDIAFPLLLDDVSAEGVLDVRVRYEVPATDSGCPSLEPVTTRLHDLVLVSTGEEVPATSVADFFPALATRIDVQVPRTADDELLTAGLTAVAALGAVYPEGTPIVLGSPGTVLPRTGTGQRVVKLEPPRGDDEASEGEASVSVTEKYGLQTLVLSGSGDALVDAARALGSSLLDLAGSDRASGLSVLPGVRDPDAEVSLAELGLEDVALSGVGLGSTSLAVPQDAFGGPVEQLRLRVVGTHTAVDPESKAQLNTYVNGFLVDSQLLGEESSLALEATVPAGRLRPVNDVRFSLAALPVDGVCPGPDTELPLEVSLDATQSTVTGTPGVGDAEGFALFPQVLGGTLPIGIRGRGRARVVAAADAAQLVLGLQRSASAPLEVQVMEAESLIAGDQGGLLVGADLQDALALQAPVPFSSFRQVDADGRTFGVDSDDPFAALQASGPPERPVLVLGSWAPRKKADTESLLQTLLEQTSGEGWSSLEGNVLIAHGKGRTFALDVAPTLPPASEDEDSGRVAWWVLPGVVVLALLLAVQVLGHVRRERTRVDRSADRPGDTGGPGAGAGAGGTRGRAREKVRDRPRGKPRDRASKRGAVSGGRRP